MGSTVSTLLASSLIFLSLPPTALATNGVDFSNNLFSDLGPVLALFGEQVAKQFMSQSLTWLEDVIFAMAPLGIITAIISAVRVGGPTWLKAVVGRARESEAAAEIELMSSTSHEVCELWNGQALVRVMGSPDIVELLYFEDMAKGGNQYGLLSLETARKKRLLKNSKETRKDGSIRAEVTPGTKKNVFSSIFSRASKSSSTDVENPQRGVNPRSTSGSTSQPTSHPSAPNISLNIVEIEARRELWIFAILGLVLQFGSLVFIGVSHYHPKINLGVGKNSGYAYPLMASGTLFLVLGMMACSHVVQASSVETTWVADKSFRILWLQQSAIVNDQRFGSYMLFTSEERKTLTTSRRRIPSSDPSSPTEYTFAAALSLQTLTLVGSFFSLAGFITQFVGIRALHWSASIAQLVVTLAMTAVRTWIRRNMSARPRAIPLPPRYDMNWFLAKFATPVRWMQEDFWQDSSEGDGDPGWRVLTLQPYRGYEPAQEVNTELMTDSKRTLETWSQLSPLTDSRRLSYDLAVELANCLQLLLSCIVTSQAITLERDFTNSTVFQWTLPVEFGDKVERITITATRSKCQRGSWHQWNLPTSEIYPIISLWSYSMRNHEQAIEGTPDGDGSFWDNGRGDFPVLRVLGPATEPFIRDCKWWMDRGGRFVTVFDSELRNNARLLGKVATLKTKELPGTIPRYRPISAENSTTSVAPHRIVGTEPGTHESLAFVSKTPLQRMCAQEILSSFMWAIAGTVQSIADKIEPRSATPHDEPDEWFNFKLENDFLEQLAKTIAKSRVTRNIQDAYALVIPPFAAARKLPGMSHVFSETRQKLKRRQTESNHQFYIPWVTEIFIELFRICNSSRRIHDSTIAVTALLIEELCSLNNTVALFTARASLEYEKETRKGLDLIKNELVQDGDKDTLGALIYLYEKQGRDTGGTGQLPSDCATEIRAASKLGNLGRLKERARWNLAHELVTDDEDRVQDIVDMVRGRVPESGFDLDAVDILGWTPLHYAANKPGDHLDLVRVILDAGGRIDPRTESDYTPLHYAAASGNAHVTSRLYGKGAAKDARNIDMRTPLHLAAEHGHPVTTRFLLSRGADIEARDKNGWTPLHYAAAKGRKGVVEKLLAKGAKEDARENQEMTPLHMAASTGQLEIVKILLDRNPKTVPRDYYSRTPLHLAALNGNGEVVEILVINTDVNTEDYEENTPLHYAAQRGNWDAVKRLLRKGANPSPPNDDNSTPLHFACRHGDINIVNDLLSAGADPTLKSISIGSQTPLEELKANKELPEDQRNKLIALLEEYTKTWLEKAETRTQMSYKHGVRRGR